ncbi:MAG: lipopolysaccharide biosynthesis protein, partial [Actinomycetota bacterium]
MRRAGGFVRGLFHARARAVGSLAAAQYISAALAFAGTILAARILGPKGFGLAALAMAYPNLVGSLTGVKSSTVTVRYLSAYRASNEASKLLSVCRLGYLIDGAASLLATVIVSATAGWANRASGGETIPLWLPIAFSLLMAAGSVGGTGGAILTAFERFHVAGVLLIVGRLISFGLMLAFLLAGARVAGLVIASGLAAAVGGALTALAAGWTLRKAGFAGNKQRIPAFSRKEIGQLFGWNYLAVTAGGALLQLPMLILGHLGGPVAAGYMRISSGVVLTATYVEGSLSRLAYPLLSKSFQTKSPESIAKTLRRWVFWRGLPIGVLILFGIPLVPALVPLTFGPEFKSMIAGLQFLLVGAAVSTTYFYLLPWYYSSGQVRLWAIANCIYASATLAAIWTLGQMFG